MILSLYDTILEFYVTLMKQIKVSYSENSLYQSSFCLLII